jgi:undecaprenyl-diphosphatase
MTIIETIVLAVVQGITEFIPVSSSGHLVIMSEVLSVELDAATLNSVIIWMHLGTLIALLLHYGKNIVGIFKNLRGDSNTLRNIIIASLPVFISGFIFAVLIEENLTGTAGVIITGFSLLITGLFFILYRPKGGKKEINQLSVKDSIIVGLFQSIAVLYGVSRSGITITGSRFVKLSNTQSLDFAFLVSIPVLIGAIVFTIFRDVNSDVINLPTDIIFTSVIVATVVGYLSITVLLKFLRNRSLSVFGLYCAVVGFTTLFIELTIN